MDFTRFTGVIKRDSTRYLGVTPDPTRYIALIRDLARFLVVISEVI